MVGSRGNPIDPLFKRNHGLTLRFVVLCLISLTIILFDHKTDHLNRVRGYFSVAVMPIQSIVSVPVQATDWVWGNVSSYQTLLKENTHLKAEQLLLHAQVQKFIAVKKENRQLRALLQSSPRNTDKVLVVELLAVATDPNTRRFVLSKGSRDGVYKGQAVLDASGVFGQIVEVSLLTSRVLLLTDRQSAIPVVDSKTGERAIAVGQGNADLLLLRHVPKTVKIAVGDILLTSGLGQRFPAGYPVGDVIRVEQNPGDTFADIAVKPSAHFNRSRLVLLVWAQQDAVS